MHLLSNTINLDYTMFNDNDLKELIIELNKILISYRPILNIPSIIFYGHEIEYRNANRDIITSYLNSNYQGWTSKTEYSISKDDLDPLLGGEITSPILQNTYKSIRELKEICAYLNSFPNISAKNTGAHLHIDANIYNRNTIYFYRLLKLWCAYEDIIYRFSAGEYNYMRTGILSYGAPIREKIQFILENKNLDENTPLLYFLTNTKCNRLCGLNFNNLINGPYNTIEIRCPNGTLDATILENNLNFFAHLLMYPTNPNYNYELINYHFSKKIHNTSNELTMRKAIELAELIFSTNIDKTYFLKQYLKNGETTKNYTLCRKITDTIP